MDQSHLDKKYFVDDHVYNCPFCNRRHVKYYVKNHFTFDWTINKKCFAYIVQCQSCKKESMHLSFDNIDTKSAGHYAYQNRFKDVEDEKLDNFFFYSVPTSFFTLDERIPKILRELFSEAEGCLKSNYLTGASACIRKVIYELAIIEEVEGENYEERIKALKDKTDIEPTYFDTLLTIQQLTSSKVHEQSYDGWESKHIRIMLSTIAEVLNELYVIPEIRAESRKNILDMKEELLNSNNKDQAT